MPLSRRSFLKAASGLLVPALGLAPAEEVRRFWSLDRTMATRSPFWFVDRETPILGSTPHWIVEGVKEGSKRGTGERLLLLHPATADHLDAMITGPDVAGPPTNFIRTRYGTVRWVRDERAPRGMLYLATVP